MNPEQEIARGHRARQILDDDLFKEAFETVEGALLAGMRNAAIVDEKLRLRLLDRYEVLHSMRDVLSGFMETGKLATRQLELEEQQRSMMERAKDYFGI
jgi:hypothetical protein